MVMVPLKPPARLDEVARIMQLMYEMPGRRDRPKEGDLEGKYDVWFDGGACDHLTSINSFTFADGSTAWLSSVSLGLKGGVRLASGEVVNFEQERALQSAQPPRPLAEPAPAIPDTCVACGGPILPGSTVQLTERGPVHFKCQ